MGQLYSSPARRRPAPVAVPPLLRMPTDIVWLIRDQLRDRPESIVSFALTCKDLYALFPVRQDQLDHNGRHALLLLYEKEKGSRCYYCDVCRRLHAFLPSCGPLDPRPATGRDHPRCTPVRCNAALRVDGPYNLFYHHARLAMNRHLYGEQCGIPLDQLSADAVQGAKFPHWSQSWRARIIDGNLVLRATHTTGNVRMGNLGQALRQTIDQQRGYLVCQNGDPSKFSVMQRGPPPAAADETREPFFARSNVLDHCETCHTDICVTVERRELPVRVRDGGKRALWSEKKRWWNRRWPRQTAWAITIVAYHNIGKCRSHFDPTWRAFSERRSWNYHRDLHTWPAGMIRAKWLAAEADNGG